MLPVAVLPKSRFPAVFPCIGALDASLLLPVISLLDGHSLVKVLCGTKLPTAIIIAYYH